MPKTAQFIEESKNAAISNPNSTPKKRGNFASIAPYCFKPGQSGNPNGRPKNDIAAEVARAVFEGNKEAIYKAMTEAMLKGNPYAFKEFADRAYGKLRESKEVTHIHEDVADKDLNARIAELERELGLAREIDEAGRIGIAQANKADADNAKQDTQLFSR